MPRPSPIAAALRRAAAAALLMIAAAPPAAAQSPVAIGAPLEGEVVLNRDVEVRVGPSPDARILLTLNRGKALNALGTPRGTAWTQVAIGGRPIGYVPADSLDPADLPRPAPPAPERRAGPGKAAGAETGSAVAGVVPREAWERARAVRIPGETVRGYAVATRDVGATETVEPKKRRPFTIRRGQVVGLLDATNGRLRLAVADRGAVVAGQEGFLGVAAPYPVPGLTPVGPEPLFAARLGEYVSFEEGMRAWTAFTGGPGQQWSDRPPMVWPLFRSGAVLYQMGVGPFTRAQIDGACATLAQRGLDCAMVDLQVF